MTKTYGCKNPYHSYLFKDPNKLQLAHDLHSLAIREWPGLDLHIISVVLSGFTSWQDMLSHHLESLTPAFCAEAPEAKSVN